MIAKVGIWVVVQFDFDGSARAVAADGIEGHRHGRQGAGEGYGRAADTRAEDGSEAGEDRGRGEAEGGSTVVRIAGLAAQTLYVLYTRKSHIRHYGGGA